MSYRRKRYYPSKYAAFGNYSRKKNVRRRTRVSRGNESYGGSVYRYNPQVGPAQAELKWLTWKNDHQTTLAINDLQLLQYAWGNQNGAYAGGLGILPTPYLMPYQQSKFVYLDDPWFCRIMTDNSSDQIWQKRVSSAILLRKIQCCFAIRPICWQVPEYEASGGGENGLVLHGRNKVEVSVNGIFRWWLLLDTQCNGTPLRNYVVGPVSGSITSNPSYIFDSASGYVSTFNELNRGRFKVVTVKDFDVCGTAGITFANVDPSVALQKPIVTFVPHTKVFDFSLDVNIPLEWSGFSSSVEESDTTYTTNRLLMVGAFITNQGFFSNFGGSDAIYTNESVFLPCVDPAMWIKSYFQDI